MLTRGPEQTCYVDCRFLKSFKRFGLLLHRKFYIILFITVSSLSWNISVGVVPLGIKRDSPAFFGDSDTQSRFHASVMSADGMPTLSQAGSDASQSQAAAGEVACACGACNKAISPRSSTAVRYAVCKGSCHVSCIVKKFTASYGTACNNSIQWLSGFLNAENFSFKRLQYYLW